MWMRRRSSGCSGDVWVGRRCGATPPCEGVLVRVGNRGHQTPDRCCGAASRHCYCWSPTDPRRFRYVEAGATRWWPSRCGGVRLVLRVVSSGLVRPVASLVANSFLPHPSPSPHCFGKRLRKPSWARYVWADVDCGRPRRMPSLGRVPSLGTSSCAW